MNLIMNQISKEMSFFLMANDHEVFLLFPDGQAVVASTQMSIIHHAEDGGIFGREITLIISTNEPIV